MLQPFGRTLLMDALRPPIDHTLDFALGTTYSLELTALLTLPIAFTLFELESPEELASGDSLAVFESLRRFADRMTVLCQASATSVPRDHVPLFEYLERQVIPCTSPRAGGLFHPKVWILRYRGPDATIRYRVLCLTRNLTFDRSWDTLLSLEGPLAPNRRYPPNRGLVDFVAGLRQCIVGTPGPQVDERLRTAAEDLAHVEFELPPDFDEVRFWPLGLGERSSWPFGDGSRLLVISPFIGGSTLTRLAAGRKESRLVSVAEWLNQAPEALHAFEKTYVLNQEAITGLFLDEQEADATGTRGALTGLHAKCYIIEEGWRSHVFTGSANATDAAFTQNVELLVQLTGQRAKVGIDRLFERASGSSESCLGDLLEPFQPSPPDPQQEIRAELTKLLEQAATALAQCGLEAHVTPAVTPTAAARVDAAGLPDGFDVEIRSQRPWIVKEHVSGRIRPISLGDGHARAIARGTTDTTDTTGTTGMTGSTDAALIARFEALSFEALTAFHAMTLTASKEDVTCEYACTLNIPLINAPADRRERLIRGVVRDRDRLIRLLLLLLANEGIELGNLLKGAARTGSWGNGSSDALPGLFETMVRAVSEAPERLLEVEHLIASLRKAGGEDLLPPEFEAVWAAVSTAAERMRACTP
jgi:PLD-like domain